MAEMDVVSPTIICNSSRESRLPTVTSSFTVAGVSALNAEFSKLESAAATAAVSAEAEVGSVPAAAVVCCIGSLTPVTSSLNQRILQCHARSFGLLDRARGVLEIT